MVQEITEHCHASYCEESRKRMWNGEFQPKWYCDKHKPKTVLITGVAGFLGTHVAEHFKDLGWNVIGIDNLTDYELKREYDIKKVRSHNLNFLDFLQITFLRADCRSFVTDTKLDFIIHCAAQPTMTLSITDPMNDCLNNVIGTVQMLGLAKQNNCPFVNCSSVHIYGNSSNDELIPEETRFISIPGEISEETPILKGEITPLHASKRATELYTQCFAETYGLRTASFRLTGMYGERQFGGMDHGWVANFAIKMFKEKPLTVFGTDKQVRDILYAKDAAEAFCLWYENGKSGIYNIGGGIDNSISIRECIDELKEEIEPVNFQESLEPKRKGDMWYFVCDYKKAKKDFNWEPKTKPKDGIKKLVEWINKNQAIL